VNIRLDARRVVERPAANESHLGARVLAEDRDLAGRAAEDALNAPVVARSVDRLRIVGEEFDPVRLDEEVDDERAPGLPLAVKAVAAVNEERVGRQPVPNRSTGTASFALCGHGLLLEPVGTSPDRTLLRSVRRW
jgi:hypothetical protein